MQYRIHLLGADKSCNAIVSRPVKPDEVPSVFGKFVSLFSDYVNFTNSSAVIVSEPGPDGVVTVDADDTIHRLSSWVFVGDIQQLKNPPIPITG